MTSSCGEECFSEGASANPLTRMVFDLVCWSGGRSRKRWCHTVNGRSEWEIPLPLTGAEERVGRWCRKVNRKSVGKHPALPPAGVEGWDDVTTGWEIRSREDFHHWFWEIWKSLRGSAWRKDIGYHFGSWVKDSWRNGWKQKAGDHWRVSCTPPRERWETAASWVRLVALEMEECLDLRHMILSWRHQELILAWVTGLC